MNQGPIQNSGRFAVGSFVGGRPMTGSLRYADEAREIPIEVRDISASGGGFMVHEPPRLRSSVVVTLVHADEVVRVSAVVRWTRAVSEGTWRIGCTFTGRCDSRLAELATVEERSSTDIAVMISRRLRGHERHSGRMVNFSEGGIRLQAARQYSIGEDLLIEWEADHKRMQFVVKVHWVQDDADGFVTGCRFAETVDVKRLQAAVLGNSCQTPVVESAAQEFRSARESSPPGIWAACAFVYVWAALNLTGYWPPGI